jgi:hypothetical protein
MTEQNPPYQPPANVDRQPQYYQQPEPPEPPVYSPAYEAPLPAYAPASHEIAYAPVPQQYAPADETVTLGNWMLTYLLLAIPLVGTIMLFVWAFGSSPASKKNWARAVLLWAVIGIVVVVILAVITGGALFSVFSDSGRNYT